MSALHGTCQDCRHFAALEQQCRARSPVPALVPGRNGQAVAIGMWPAATKDQWCGEFAPEKSLADRLTRN